MATLKNSRITSINISESEHATLILLAQKGIRIVDCFRRGLEAYEKDLLLDKSQN